MTQGQCFHPLVYPQARSICMLLCLGDNIFIPPKKCEQQWWYIFAIVGHNISKTVYIIHWSCEWVILFCDTHMYISAQQGTKKQQHIQKMLITCQMALWALIFYIRCLLLLLNQHFSYQVNCYDMPWTGFWTQTVGGCHNWHAMGVRSDTSGKV